MTKVPEGFKGYALADVSGFSLSFKPEYISRKGENHGPVVFVGPATKSKIEFKSVHDALEAALKAKEIPADARTLVDRHYMKLETAAKLDLGAYSFYKDGEKRGWGIAIMSDAKLTELNNGYATGTKPKAESKTPVKKSLF